jgi:hypothetical protein
MRRVLVDNGRVAISVWQALERHPQYGALFQATARHLGVSTAALDVALSLADVDELSGVLRDAGFRNVGVAARSLDVRLAAPERFVESHGTRSGGVNSSICATRFFGAFRTGYDGGGRDAERG